MTTFQQMRQELSQEAKDELAAGYAPKTLILSPEHVNLQKCAYCGHEGEFGKEVIMIDFRSPITNRDGSIPACRDIDACFKRGGNHTRPDY